MLISVWKGSCVHGALDGCAWGFDTALLIGKNTADSLIACASVSSCLKWGSFNKMMFRTPALSNSLHP